MPTLSQPRQDIDQRVRPVGTLQRVPRAPLVPGGVGVRLLHAWIPRCLRAACQAVCVAVVLMAVAPAAVAREPDLPDPVWRPWQTGAMRPDRLQHFSLGFTSGVAIGVATREPAAAAAGSLVLGLVKELIDMRNSHFDWGDLYADAAGAALSAGVTASLFR